MPATLQNKPRPETPSRARQTLEVLASMRLTLALLTVVCIASLVGVAVEQREPYAVYVKQFGPLWAELFEQLGLYHVDSAWWLLLTLALLLLSGCLGIARKLGPMLRDLLDFKEQMLVQSLQTLPLKAIGHLRLSPDEALQGVWALLKERGWRSRTQGRERGVMVAARKGVSSRLGDLLVHGAALLIGMGGLVNSDLMLRAQMYLQGKSVYAGGGLIRDIDASHRLNAASPSFHGSLLVPEGGRAAAAVLNTADGVLLQDLPFEVELKKLTTELEAPGMPRRFASNITLHDRDSAARRDATVTYKEPVTHRGITIQQSGTDDGGSRLSLRLLPLTGDTKPKELQAVVGGSAEIGNAAQPQRLELTGLRLESTEKLSEALSSSDPQHSIRTPHPLGVSFSYLLRDAAGRTHEFNNVMAPVTLGGRSVFLAGVREHPGEDFSYLRIPADAQGSKRAWLRLRADLAKPELREWAARRYAAQATPNEQPGMMPELYVTAKRALSLFSGADASHASESGKPALAPGGLPALSQFVDTEVPEGERRRVSEVLLRILNGSLLELYKLGLEQRHQAAPESNAALQNFMTQAMLALSDSMVYPATFLVELDDFSLVRASVFQIARAPGWPMIYLGLMLLLPGVLIWRFARTRRLWIWLEPAPGLPGFTRVRMAMTSTRESAIAAAEFASFQQAILGSSA